MTRFILRFSSFFPLFSLMFTPGVRAAVLPAHSLVSKVRICWGSEPNALYTLQYRPGLDEGEWLDQSPPRLATDTQTCVTLPVSGRSGYFRVVRDEAGPTFNSHLGVAEMSLCWLSASNLIYRVQVQSESNSAEWGVRLSRGNHHALQLRRRPRLHEA